jgi:hypothetical protein
VIANTDAALAKWQERLPLLSNRCRLIWNGFDPEERIQALPIITPNRKVLSHVGELYHGRVVTPILESIARLIAANRLHAGNVLVRLIGPALTECLPSPEFIQRAKSDGWLELVTERIPQQEAIRITQTSSSLLLIQTQSATQVPGKLFEYLQVGRPILGFVQQHSPSERLLERSGVPYLCVYPGSTPETIDNIVADFFDLPCTPVGANSWFEEQFNAAHQARVLDALIQFTHSARPSRQLATSNSFSKSETCRRLIAGNSALEPEHFRDRSTENVWT